MSVYPWFHGSLSRAEAEERLKQAETPGMPSDSIIFLVRMKTGSDRDCVLTWKCPRGPATNFVIKLMGAGSNKTYFVDAKLETKSKYFSELHLLIEHYMEPGTGFPGGHLQVPVVSPTPIELPEPEGIPLPPPEKGVGPPPGPLLPGQADGSRRANPDDVPPIPHLDTPAANAPPPVPLSSRPSMASRPSDTSLPPLPPLPPQGPPQGGSDAPPPLPPQNNPPAGRPAKKGCTIL